MFDHDNRDAPRGADSTQDDDHISPDERRTLVDQLVALAEHPETVEPVARLYLATALWLESERNAQPGEDRTELTRAAERIKGKGAAKPPANFRFFLRSWLADAMADPPRAVENEQAIAELIGAGFVQSEPTPEEIALGEALLLAELDAERGLN